MNNKFLQYLLILTILIGLAWIGKSVLLPFIFAFLFWLVITSWQDAITKISVFAKIPSWMQMVVSIGTFAIILFLLSGFLAADLRNFSKIYPALEQKVTQQSVQLEAYTGIDIAAQLETNLQEINIALMAQKTANTFSTALGTIFTIFLYVLFMFTEQKFFPQKIKAASGKHLKERKRMMGDILDSIKQYISIKTTLSVMTAVLSYIVMVFMGLELPFVWAFLIFVLNYLPSIGSIIATIFPVGFALLSFDSWGKAVVLLVLIAAIQVYIGNVLEPKYMGDKLNVSSLLLIFALFFWGALWGIPGMFLAVPLTVIIMIILSGIPSTKPIGILMSGDGKV